MTPIDPALQGWKARACTAKVNKGILRLSDIGDNCFLGFSTSKHHWPTTANFRIKANANLSHFEWLPGKA